MSLIDQAIIFAATAHGGIEHRRKWSGIPYIAHPIEVMTIVATVPDHTEVMLAAAVLHDTVEDTRVSESEIQDRFGLDVMLLVHWLTDVALPGQGNRAQRNEINRLHSAQAPAEAQTIKLADLISNTKDIVVNDPGFARTYLREKRQLLDILDKGDRRLWWEAMGLCQSGFEQLDMEWV